MINRRRTTAKAITLAILALSLGFLSGPWSWDGEGYSRTTEEQIDFCDYLRDTAETPEDQAALAAADC